MLCTREIQRTISESVHQLLKDQIGLMELDSFYTVTDNNIKGRNGSDFLFAGIRQQDVTKLKSFEGVDIAWVEEAQVVTEKSWEVLVPTIRRPGSEIWVTFNPELDTDPTYVRFIENPQPDSFVIKMNYRDNPWFPDVLEQERLTLKERDPVAYANVWEGSCRAAVDGAIYAEEVRKAIEQGRVCNVPYDPILKVHAVWDLGWGVMAIAMVQRQASEMRFIDYEEYNHTRYDEVVKDLESRDYRWGRDFLPHDAKSHNPQTGKSPLEFLKALGRDVYEVPDIGKEPGIEATRQMFPRCYFDKQKTSRLVHCLKRYRRRVDQVTLTPKNPIDDEFTHGADTLRYSSVIAEKMTNDDFVPMQPPPPQPYFRF